VGAGACSCLVVWVSGCVGVWGWDVSAQATGPRPPALCCHACVCVAVICGVIGMAAMIGLSDKFANIVNTTSPLPNFASEYGSGFALGVASWICSFVGIILSATLQKPNPVISAVGSAI
jgi:hypothetical protein